jgi:chemotaxis protein methyltransferase CheR
MTTSLHSRHTVPAGLTTCEAVDPLFQQIRDLVYTASGIFLPDEKLYLLAAGCNRRIQQLPVLSPSEYWIFLKSPSHTAELRELLNEITIGETSLFRNRPQLNALRRVILPALTKKTTRAAKHLRIWCAGCSTGEEPYTLAMTMLEAEAHLLKGWTIEIQATDLNDRSLEAAQIGIYGDYALRTTTAHFKNKYFSPVDTKTMRVHDEVKKLVTFRRLNLQDESSMNLVKDMDVIFCRNVLIYFNHTSKSQVIRHFFSSLNLGGYLFLGTAESLMKLNRQFHPVHFPGTIAYRKPSLDALPL